MNQRYTSARGFTLIEMLITIVVVTILIGLSAAGMQPQIARSQAETAQADLQQDLIFARGEAVKRGGWVGICGSDNGATCSASFQNGWLVFHDVDKDREFNNADNTLTSTRQAVESLAITVEQADGAVDGPLMFNYRGYPDRSILLRVVKGEVDSTVIQHTSGRVVLK